MIVRYAEIDADPVVIHELDDIEVINTFYNVTEKHLVLHRKNIGKPVVIFLNKFDIINIYSKVEDEIEHDAFNKFIDNFNENKLC